MPKRKWMMHDELYAALPNHVYIALDACAHLPPAQRSKLQAACTPFDVATEAPLGHDELQLTLAENAHFDPVKRGLALAIAGRSAGVETSGVTALLDATGRRAILQEFHAHWSLMENHFGGAHEISGTNVSRLWDGVCFIMQASAARSTSWGCPEIETACREQYEPTARPSPPPSPSRPPRYHHSEPPAQSTRHTFNSSSRSGGSMFSESLDDAVYDVTVKDLMSRLPMMSRLPPPTYTLPLFPGPRQGPKGIEDAFDEEDAYVENAFALEEWDRFPCPFCGRCHREVLYAFPPTALLNRFVAKARAGGVCAILDYYSRHP
jgi:hypothetical protein